MSDPARSNSPSRKSRFRAQGRGRPAGHSPAQEAADDMPAEGDAAHMVEAEHAAAPPPEESSEAGLEESGALPAGLRLTRDPDQFVERRGLSTGLVVLLTLAALAVGAVAGYLARQVPAAANVEAARNLPPQSLSAETQAAVEAAFNDTKQGRYADARKRFETLYSQHPEWSSMGIEAARASLYQRDLQATQTQLAAATRDHPLVDATLLRALTHLTAHEYDAADDLFASAAATDPARADVYYFWGENLRREGKPQQAAGKFQSAIVRNQYENVEPLYLLKYWISLVQSDQDAASGEGAKIDASLASGHPSSAALFAGVARAVKAGKYKDAADLLGKAQAVTDPMVFGVVLRDPLFTEASSQPELARFYK